MQESLNFARNSQKNKKSQEISLNTANDNVNIVAEKVVFSKIMKSGTLEIKIDGRSVKRLREASLKTGLSAEEIVRVGLLKILDTFDFTGRIEVESKSIGSNSAVVQANGMRT